MLRTILRVSTSSSLRASSIRSFATSIHFTKDHEYVKVEDGGLATVGITDYAQSQLGDVVFVSVPEVGAKFKKGDSFGSVESVKAASDVYAPVSGTIEAVNTALSADPSIVNTSAESTAWFVKFRISQPEELKTMMDAAAYKKHVESEKH